MNIIAIVKEYMKPLLDLIKELSVGNIIELHLKHKATLETNKIIRVSNKAVIFIIILVLGIILFLRYFKI